VKTDLLIAGVLCIGAVAGLGLLAQRRWSRRRRERGAQAGFARQLAEQEAAAREQLAAEIQNGFGHRLVLLRHGALTALAQPGSPPAAQEELGRISGLALSALDEARALAERLRPVELERLGFAKAVEDLLARQLANLGMRVFKEVDDLGSALSPAAVLYLYRLVEAMVREAGQQVGVTTVVVRGEAGAGAGATAAGTRRARDVPRRRRGTCGGG
jgi:signal transduction histidine kinase